MLGQRSSSRSSLCCGHLSICFLYERLSLQIPQVGRSWRMPLPVDVRDAGACDSTVCGALGHCALPSLQWQMSWNRVFYPECRWLRGGGSEVGTGCRADMLVRAQSHQGRYPKQLRTSAAWNAKLRFWRVLLCKNGGSRRFGKFWSLLSLQPR